MRKRLGVVASVVPVAVVAVVLIAGLAPVAATAQTTEEAAAIEGVQEALSSLDCVTPEGCTEELAELKAALAVMKAVFPDLNYFGLDGAIRWVIEELNGHLHGPPTGQDAVDDIRSEGAALVADAKAAAAGDTTTTAQVTTTTTASTTSTSAGDTPTTTLEAAAGGDSSSRGVPAIVWIVGGIALLALLAWLLRMLVLRFGGA
ncbi:MAG: hypothetical protein ACR2N7_05685 [Acidimicrobiia bacterium]